MRYRNISLLINSVEYQCRARTCELNPLSNVTLCTDNIEYELVAEIEVTYNATTGTWNLLRALADAGTATTIVIKPSDTTVAATNPSATFSAVIPPVPFIAATTPGEKGTFTMTTQSEGGVVFAVA